MELSIPPLWVALAALLAAWRVWGLARRGNRSPLTLFAFIARAVAVVVYFLSAIGEMDLATRSVWARWCFFVVLAVEVLEGYAAKWTAKK